MTTTVPQREKLDDNVVDIVKRIVAEGIPFNRYLGMQLTEIHKGFARIELPFRPELVGDPHRPALHGGVISALCDTCGGIAAFSVIGPTDRVSTVDLRIDYLQPGREERLISEGEVVRAGNRVCLVDLRAFHPSAPASPVAHAKAVYNIYRSPSGSAVTK